MAREILTVGVGQSKDPKEAVRTAMQKTKNPTLTVVFASSNLDPNEVYTSIKEEVGNSHISVEQQQESFQVQ